MKIKSSLLVALPVFFLGVLPSGAALTIASESFTYAQNFDALSSAATSTWTNDSTLAGWSMYKSDLTSTTVLNGGNGGSNTGGFWSYGATASGERALGGLGSSNVAAFGDTDPGVPVTGPGTGVTAGYITLSLNNATGGELSSITVGFSGEQWRNGGNVSLASQTMTFQYGFGATFAAVTTWTAPGGAFNWASPVTAATAAAVDGNSSGLVTGLGGTLSDLAWADGGTLWIRWLEVNDAGNDHGLAIDNFAVTSVTAVPEPDAAALLGAVGLLGLIRRRR
ncbi:MAG: PEP-CTERM sorting domain-containing protein [Verrucomicrobiota bacterium]